MITVQQEESIRRLIPFETDWEIWKETGFPRYMITYIRKMVDICDNLSESQKKEVQELLLLKIPVDAIELKTRIHRDKILAIRRYYYLQNRKIEDGCRCPTCGRTDLEHIKEIMEKINGKKSD